MSNKDVLEECATLVREATEKIEQIKKICKDNNIMFRFTLPLDTENEYTIPEFEIYSDGSVYQWVSSSVGC